MKLGKLSPPYETERLILRPFAVGDRDHYAAYHSRPDVYRHLYAAAPTGDALDRQFQAALEARFEPDGDVLRFAVARTEDGVVVGEVLLKMASRKALQGEVGYIFNPSFAGNGYATEAVAALLRVGFAEIGFHRIFARLDASNDGSIGVVKRLGFRREAHLIENDRFDGKWGDEYIYAQLQGEWKKRVHDWSRIRPAPSQKAETRRYYTITTAPSAYPPGMVIAKDDDAAWDALRENKPYPHAFSADEISPDEFELTDFLHVNPAIPMVTKRFRDAMLAEGMDDLNFYETIVMYGPENLMSWIGDEVGGLYCATYRHVVDVIDDIDPVRFWPHLKRFKSESFVITRPLPEGAMVARDRKRLSMPICTEAFKTWCEEQKLNVGFFELPTYIEET